MLGRDLRVAVWARGVLTAGVIVMLTLGTARGEGCQVAPATGAFPTQITPVTLRVLQPAVTPVAATDGFVHLAYAAQITNVGRDPANLDTIVPTDFGHPGAATGTNLVRDMNGKDITGTVRLFNPEGGVNAANTRRLPGGASGIMFFDVRYRTLAEVPRLVSHRLSISFHGDRRLVEDIDPVVVNCKAPVVIAPPLVGDGWWDGNGCCEVISPHRGATLPVNGGLRAPEQFAIDFVQLTGSDACCTGPVKQLSSWPFLGAPVFAVADGVVVDRVDGMAEQVPGEVKGVTALNAPGNNIIEDIGGQHYVLYAHFRTGSIPKRIVAGTRLRRGEQIGEVGNTGSSTAPHLHFQVMDRPSALNAIGLPFVFDRQIVQGRVSGTASETNDRYEAGGKLTIVRGSPVLEVNRIPAEGQVVRFDRR
ncbi:M23 family metallopeptidase [Rhodopila sp.]|uniref:M23 family metallopeptidase n=1 Tax=Rhodopila sp. TaxID=2480087 RepID=UPI003D0F00BA